ncbi:preprotein translocase, SecY subunit [Oscillochloris trichoides DG-6]|uniref:Protein translocase subunit SecY n=1 Tax=Oscillochloris trichoides DG-6 TaxID=765420 RepID=E1IA29_9CHLR|nr:preprotein translocase subunit SecY [Oscillochloris trichoides]EFO82031.1 preprotein translocase, SecY subunit [Oscillochloris trichoides DG-6]
MASSVIVAHPEGIPMLQAVLRAIQLPDLRRRILFTLGMLMIFRLIAHIPVPNISPNALDQLQSALANNQLAQLLNIFAGGALQNFSVAAMGVYPYITASIIMQLLQPLIPALQELSKEGEQGRIKMNRYQMWLTIPLAYLQAYGQTQTLEYSVNPTGDLTMSLFRSPFNIATNFLPTFTILTTMVAGTMLLVWLGEQINERGIGQGISVIIFGGIVSRLPGIFVQGWQVSQAGGLSTFIGVVGFLIIALVTIVGMVLVQEGQRRIPVQYAKRVRGNKVYGGQSSNIPLKVNMAGMIPLIFAQSIIIFPGIIASWFYRPGAEGIGNAIAGFFYTTFNPTGQGGGVIYMILLFLLTVGFTYFYTIVLFSQQDIPDSLQRNGGFIPGIRPGKKTEEYLGRVLNRITLVGALFLGLVAILPFLTQSITGVQLGLGSTALLIVVGVAIDTMRQLESQLLMRDYEGFLTR